jgi:hypothetical protein
MITEKPRNPSAIRSQETSEAVWAILMAAGDAGINTPEAAQKLRIAAQTFRNHAHELGAWCIGGSKNARWYMLRNLDGVVVPKPPALRKHPKIPTPL